MSSGFVPSPIPPANLARALPIPPRAVPKRDGPRNDQGASVTMSNEIDLHLGKRLRRRRRLLGLTQQQLAGAVGVRFQQIQKYECGANRISAARLWQLAKALETPINYFYDGLSDDKTEVAAINNEGIEV